MRCRRSIARPCAGAGKGVAITTLSDSVWLSVFDVDLRPISASKSARSFSFTKICAEGAFMELMEGALCIAGLRVWFFCSPDADTPYIRPHRHNTGVFFSTAQG